MKYISEEPIEAPSGLPVNVPGDEGNRDLAVQLALSIMTGSQGVKIETMEDAKHAFRISQLCQVIGDESVAMEDADYEWVMGKLTTEGPRIFGMHAFKLHERFAEATDAAPTTTTYADKTRDEVPRTGPIGEAAPPVVE